MSAWVGFYVLDELFPNVLHQNVYGQSVFGNKKTNQVAMLDVLV